MAADLTLVNYRRPLENAKKLTPIEKKQIAALLKQEGTTITKAAKDEEWSMEAVDVVDGKGNAKYQLYLWPFGSGALLAAGTTKVVANIAQHGFDMVEEDAALRTAVAAAWKASAKKLKVQERVEFSAPNTAKPAAKPTTTTLPDLASLKEAARGDSATWDRNAAAMKAWRAKLFPEPKQWKTYPKLKPSDLSAEQRLFIEKSFELGTPLGFEVHGLWDYVPALERFIGLTPSGPSDAELRVGKDSLPVWCAVANLASGHLDPSAVLAAFKKLPAARALDAWKEIATGDAYEVHVANSTSMKETDSPKTKLKEQYYTRLFSWMADAALTLGEPGRKAAMSLLDNLRPRHEAHAVYIGALSLVRAGGELPAKYDAVLSHISPTNKRATAWAEPLRKEIFKARGMK